MGPQSGQGVPAEPDEVGLSWELISFNTTFTGKFEGQIPGWTSGDFVSLSAFYIVESRIVPSLSLPARNKTEYVFLASSLVDFTQNVSSTGFVSVTPSYSKTSNSTILFASYARRSYARACIAASQDPENIFQNGSFAVDHFSSAGAKLTTTFLETHVIPPNSSTRALLKAVGQYVWEDSVEIATPTYWTPNFLAAFRQQNGYDLRPYVALLTGFNGDLMNNDPPISIVSDDLQQATIVDDYRSTLTSLYQEYLIAMRDWTHDYLGLQFSAQVGYNLPVDMVSSIPYVDVPETETLSFRNDIDGFRQYSGAASLAGQKIVSIELGADYGETYSQLLTTLMTEASRAYAVGINQVVIHGASYSGYYPQTTYPGFTTFSYTFAGHHSRHQPAWNLGYEAMLNWLARAQFVLQSGVPKVDVVFWNKQTAQDPFPDSLYKETDLNEKGYSYTYLSPDNFALPTAVIEDSTLAPSTLGAKALVLRENDLLTLYGVEKLVEYASAGLPIIIQGNLPARFTTSNTSGTESAKNSLRSIVKLPNVHQIIANPSSPSSFSNGLASLLTTLGIRPRIAVHTNGVWYTRYVVSSSDAATSVFIFSDSVIATAGTVNVNSTGVPLMLDLYTGSKSHMLEYEYHEHNATVSIPLTLAAKQAVIIQFDTAEDAGRTHIKDAPKEVLGYDTNCSDGSILTKIGPVPEPKNITLSDNTTIDLGSFVDIVPSAFNLSDWLLIAEKWVPPTNLSDINGVVKNNATFTLPGNNMVPWSSIEGLANSSGIGIYSNNFNWPPSGISNETTLGAFLKIHNSGAIQGISATINGQSLGNLDIFNPVQDITACLTTGTNLLEIRISTTLWNSLRPVWTQLKTGGIGPQIIVEPLSGVPQMAALAMEQTSGLVGWVEVIPYQTLKINLVN